MLTDEEQEAIAERPKRGAKSRMPCIVLPIVVGFALVLCYVTIVVVRNISPTAIRQTEGRRATATMQSSQQADAGATIAVELAAEATQTALAQPSTTPETPNVEEASPQTTRSSSTPAPPPPGANSPP